MTDVKTAIDSTSLWDYDDPIAGAVTDSHPEGYDIPNWIDQEITGTTVAAIRQGGCASGAYMDAVTYYDARRTMDGHGDAVLEYIECAMGEIPQPKDGESWSGFAVFYLSMAVELWAATEFDDWDR